MSQVELPPTITVDNKEYQIDTLSDSIKEMIALHQIFTNDLRESRIKVVKDELAREHLGVKIANMIKVAENEAIAQAPVAADEPTDSPAGE